MSLRPHLLPGGFRLAVRFSHVQPAARPEWLIEIKHEGLRVIARKQGQARLHDPHPVWMTAT
jgi:hypothetical protein